MPDLVLEKSLRDAKCNALEDAAAAITRARDAFVRENFTWGGFAYTASDEGMGSYATGLEEAVKIARSLKHMDITQHNDPKCNHWPGQKRCGVCGMGVPDATGSVADTDVVTMARAAEKDERLSDGALYGKLADEIEHLRSRLEIISDEFWRVKQAASTVIFECGPDRGPSNGAIEKLRELVPNRIA